MKYFTMILKVPDDWRPGPELMDNPYFTAGSWSHVMDERDQARRQRDQLALEVEGLRNLVEQLKEDKHGT